MRYVKHKQGNSQNLFQCDIRRSLVAKSAPRDDTWGVTILFSQKQIRENIEATDAKIIHRTQAKNHKSPHETFADEQAACKHIMSEQIKAFPLTLQGFPPQKRGGKGAQ